MRTGKSFVELEKNNMLKELRSLNEECGVYGVYNVENAAQVVNLGLHMLQHRGQDGAGIISYDSSDNRYYKYKDFGLVSQVFNDERISELKGNTAIGHVRYATSGGNGIENIQPFLFYKSSLSFSLCHNGNIVNSNEVKRILEERGSIFQSNSDSEILGHLIMHNYDGDIVKALQKSLNLLEGAFAFLVMFDDQLYACRDRHGLRPLSIGKLNQGYVVSSETCAFELTGALHLRDVKPGEIVEIGKDGIQTHTYAKNSENRICAMEYIYFARPDSEIEGRNVHQVRYETGVQLAREAKIDADVVMGVPDSSLSAAMGFAAESGIPYDIGLVKHKYVGRTFIEPTQTLRENSVKMKLSVIRQAVNSKRVILVDDSIVRGTTSMKMVKLLKEAGAREVHMMITSPPLRGACFYGVDISEQTELIAHNRTVDEISKAIEADSLNYLSLEGLKTVLNEQKICHGCFDLKYPTYLYQEEK